MNKEWITELPCTDGQRRNKNTNSKTIAFFLFPELTPLDLVGPATVLEDRGFNVEYVWHNREKINTEINSFKFYPSITFDELEYVDILCVPGALDPFSIMRDEKAMRWLNKVGKNAEYVTSVCTGSIILAAAGLMNGYKAATHWLMGEYLTEFGAIPVHERVVIDRNRITGGGITAGIEFGLQLLSILRSEDEAKTMQLIMHYDPQPPFNAGTPNTAGDKITKMATDETYQLLAQKTPDYQQSIMAAKKFMEENLC
ncbi:DJ-1/PfpI family protein [Xenorhabdus szentirmaii]|uniref:ThiJ/PfpI domain protein n=1 Tax=Xenorhabdus szentirmaii DSM 16338 TaxID=1427518 RepID=W1J2U7_9GAMM|nr:MULTISPECIES: DJ-1/PfpI family protein [Xenorhabdus]MBD2780894.1 DJ-1/PfpI family protein [Xenorhabdus sp. 38]MBD2822465.1 DJ-1/PfpI family protein [Xenorhabdus sp. 42]MBD2823494.1 DJ-1/PfpI family protein [Xenorhabdus sp. 5]PHM33995.1 hypothetical protein Xsze_00386 [Xenorhabdus szentirmaii DSM 16338]PHM42738.1 hypothetical protein Xszus_02482 [Xenorhabdus szentirmaii]